MKQLVLKGCGCLSTLLCLGIGSLYWLTRPTNVDWHKRSRDGISDLRAVHWEGKNLAGADLSGILFRESWLNEANFSNANLRGTDFSGATYIDDANLSNADLTGANLYGTYARRANFTGANLREAVLQHANLTGANLSNVDFAGADLSDATLVGARLTAWINPPKYLDRANLTDADLPNGYEGFPATRLCNTIMPNGNASKQGCLWPTKNLRQSLASKDWRWADNDINNLFREVIIAEQPTAKSLSTDSLSDTISRMSCQDLKVLNELWHNASDGHFSFSQQRQIWESPEVQQNYGQFADVVGWKQNNKWLKYKELKLDQVTTENRVPGHLPWHRWQVQEPTDTDPTRFRRIGFGAWMRHLKKCGV